MATVTWTGTNSGDMDDAGNWDAGVPLITDNAMIMGSEPYAPASGTCVAPVWNNGTIAGGTFSNTVLSGSWPAQISGGTFNAMVTASGQISGGTFNAGFTSNGSWITGGTFIGAFIGTLSFSSGANYSGITDISGITQLWMMSGTWDGSIGTVPAGCSTINSGATISGGTFNGPISNDSYQATVTGGTFNGEFTNKGSVYGSPTFNGTLIIPSGGGWISGGVFTGLKSIKFMDSPTFTLGGGGGGGINASGIIGMV